MLLRGAEGAGMSHRQCMELLEGAEDTLDLLASTLTYLIHAEMQKDRPNTVLVAEWTALRQEAFDVEHSLPGSDVATYQRVLEVYGHHARELGQLVRQYMYN